MSTRLLSLVLLLLALARPSAAAIVESTSCTRHAVQQAVDRANAGDTVRLPPCHEIGWDGTVTIAKRLTLEGRGTAQTRIDRAVCPADYPSSNPMFLVSNATGVAMQGMTLNGTHDTHPNRWRDMGIRVVNSVDFRVHHMAFTHLAAGIHLEGNPQHMRGLIDHNTFTDMYYSIPGVRSLGYGVSVNGNGTWPALELGTAQNIFIEDNTFTRNRHSVASNNGSRYVFRHNTILDNREDAAAIDAHGDAGKWREGSRQYEIYNNIIQNSVTRFAGIGPRGGDGVIFDNVMSAMSSGRDIHLMNDSGCGGQREDQIEDLHVWANQRLEGGAAQVTTSCAASIRKGQEYHLIEHPGYTPYRYPHPLATGGSPAPDKPQGPRNVRILGKGVRP